jgi:hypothetical protein
MWRFSPEGSTFTALDKSQTERRPHDPNYFAPAACCQD